MKMSKTEGKRSKEIPAWKQTGLNAPNWFLLVLPSLGSLIAVGWYYFKNNQNTFSGSTQKLPQTLAERFAYVLSYELFPVATLVFAIHWVWLNRMRSPMTRNPLSGHEHLVETSSNILSNTVEQLLLHVLNVLIFAVLAPPERLHFIKFVVFIFTIGRVAFAVGYTVHPKYRIPGFAWTMTSSMGLFFYNSYLVANQ